MGLRYLLDLPIACLLRQSVSMPQEIPRGNELNEDRPWYEWAGSLQQCLHPGFPRISIIPDPGTTGPLLQRRALLDPGGYISAGNFTVITKPASVPRPRELKSEDAIHSEALLGAQPNLKGAKSSGGILESLQLCFCVAPESLLRHTEK